MVFQMSAKDNPLTKEIRENLQRLQYHRLRLVGLRHALAEATASRDSCMKSKDDTSLGEQAQQYFAMHVEIYEKLMATFKDEIKHLEQGSFSNMR